jgi:hypothetical protein
LSTEDSGIGYILFMISCISIGYPIVFTKVLKVTFEKGICLQPSAVISYQM